MHAVLPLPPRLSRWSSPVSMRSSTEALPPERCLIPASMLGPPCQVCGRFDRFAARGRRPKDLWAGSRARDPLTGPRGTSGGRRLRARTSARAGSRARACSTSISRGYVGCVGSVMLARSSARGAHKERGGRRTIEKNKGGEEQRRKGKDQHICQKHKIVFYRAPGARKRCA